MPDHNDWYNVRRNFVDFTRANVRYIAAELALIAAGVGGLPTKNQLSGNVQVSASEATGSAADAYILTSVYETDELVKNLVVQCIMTNTNAGASTLKLDSLAQKDIKNIDGSTLVGGSIVAGWPHIFVYDGTKWLLMNSAKAVVVSVVLDEALTPRSFERNVAITAFTLPAASGGSAPYTYAVTGLPAGLVFDDSSREVSGTPTALGSSTVVYTVTDSNAVEFAFQFTIRVVASVLSVTSPMDRTLTVGNAYSFALATATDGTPPYTYAIDDDDLPAGMEFDPESRILSGTPTESGLFDIDYVVTDSGDTVQTATQTFRFTIRSATVLSLASVNDRTFVPDESITPFILPAATGGVPGYTYIVTGLPEGLEFDPDPDTREVSGTPTATGENEITYRVSDAEGTQHEVEFNINIETAGRRYIAVLESRVNVTALQVQSGNNYSPSERELELPDWTGDRYIVIAQPEDNDDLTHISLSGVGNSISAFEKASYTRTINGIDYEIWVGREVQGGAVISGEIINVQP